MLISPKRKVILVELKGNNLRMAARQIYNTLKTIENDIKDANVVSGRIVVSRVMQPRIGNDPVILKLMKKLKAMGGELKYKSRQMQESA